MRPSSRRRRRPLLLVLVVVAETFSIATGVPAHAAIGDLARPPDPDACVTDDGTASPYEYVHCGNGVALNASRGAVVSPDGKNVYVAARDDDAVAIFDRGAAGKLTQKPGHAGCVSDTGTAGACEIGQGLDNAVYVTISPDGRSVYVTGFSDDAVAVFDRDTSGGATHGELSQKTGIDGCVSETGTEGACSDAISLIGPRSVLVSNDDKTVYVAARDSNAIAVFDRDTSGGATHGRLTQKPGTAGCISDTGTEGACIDATELRGPSRMTLSPDDRSLYLAAETSDSVLIFDRDTSPNDTHGELTQKPGTTGCVTETGAGPCADGRAIDGAYDLAVSPDGLNLYVVSDVSDAITVFDRNASGGAQHGEIAMKGGTDACIADLGWYYDCYDAAALNTPRGVAVSQDGASVFVVTSTDNALLNYDREPGTGLKHGRLKQRPGTGCFSRFAHPNCNMVEALTQPFQVTLSPDDRSVYLPVLEDDGITTFRRSAASTIKLTVDDVTTKESVKRKGKPLRKRFATFTISLDPPGETEASFTAQTRGKTAISGEDYQPVFVVDYASTTMTVKVPILHDKTVEPDETFHLVIRDVRGATVVDPTGVATIIDASRPPRRASRR